MSPAWSSLRPLVMCADDAVTRTRASAILKRASLGSLLAGLLVVVEGGVVVLARLGGLALLEVGVGRLGVKAGDADAKADDGQKQREARTCWP